MNNICKILEQARRGDEKHSIEIENYIKNFHHIILHGAGKFGSAMGALLIKWHIPLQRLCYWDIRASEMTEVNHISVIEPFSLDFDRKKTLIINCIPNGSLSGSIFEKKYMAEGYFNCISGMALFEALFCGMKANKGFDAEICIRTTFCNWCACERLTSLLYDQCKKLNLINQGKKLILPVATFVINQKCTLKCLHCGQFINDYLPEDRINFPFERIKTDIDRISAAVDAVGFVSIIGGEPFLHPDLNDVIDLVLAKPNFGVLGITTNGICNISESHLKKMRNNRIRLIFSDYSKALSKKQCLLFEKNIKLVSQNGINFTVGQPLWSMPGKLKKLNFPLDVNVKKKFECNDRDSCKTIQNGIYYPCSLTATLGSHRIADYYNDWVKIDEMHSTKELREKILNFDDLAYFESCDHCGDGGGLLPFPGEQIKN